MNLDTLITDAGFEVLEFDSTGAVGVYANEFYLLRTREWDQKIDLAYRKGFDHWANSSIRTLSISEDEKNLEDFLKFLSLEPLAIKDLQSGSICWECAFRYNLHWPKGHVATFWQGECSQCLQDRGCCSTGDYNYAGRKVRGMRD